MKFLSIVAFALLLLISFFAIEIAGREVHKFKETRRVRYEKMQPSKGTIGFVKTKYY